MPEFGKIDAKQRASALRHVRSECVSALGLRLVGWKQRGINLPAPYLKRVWLDEDRVSGRPAYPFCPPLLHPPFALEFSHPITMFALIDGK